MHRLEIESGLRLGDVFRDGEHRSQIIGLIRHGGIIYVAYDNLFSDNEVSYLDFASATWFRAYWCGEDVR